MESTDRLSSTSRVAHAPGPAEKPCPRRRPPRSAGHRSGPGRPRAAAARPAPPSALTRRPQGSSTAGGRGTGWGEETWDTEGKNVQRNPLGDSPQTPLGPPAQTLPAGRISPSLDCLLWLSVFLSCGGAELPVPSPSNFRRELTDKKKKQEAHRCPGQSGQKKETRRGFY